MCKIALDRLASFPPLSNKPFPLRIANAAIYWSISMIIVRINVQHIKQIKESKKNRYVITWTRASGRDSNITRSTPKGHDICSRTSLSAIWTQRRNQNRQNWMLKSRMQDSITSFSFQNFVAIEYCKSQIMKIFCYIL